MTEHIMVNLRDGTASGLEESNLPSNFQIILELPIAQEDAKRRKLPRNICKLVVRCDELQLQSKECQLQALAELLFSWRKSDQLLVAQPINLFRTIKQTKNLLVEQGLEHQSISDFSLSVTCQSQSEALFLLEHIEAEAVVFFFVSNPSLIRSIEGRATRNVAYDNQYERPYLEDLNDCDGFIFYADSHKSFEILGLHNFVMKCFRPIAS